MLLVVVGEATYVRAVGYGRGGFVCFVLSGRTWLRSVGWDVAVGWRRCCGRFGVERGEEAMRWEDGVENAVAD